MRLFKNTNYTLFTRTVFMLGIAQVFAYAVIAIFAWILFSFFGNGTMGDFVYVILIQLLLVFSVVLTVCLAIMSLMAAMKEPVTKGKNLLYGMSLFFLLMLFIPYVLMF